MMDFDQKFRINFIEDILDDKTQQRLTVRPNTELTIVITIPHNVFEWFVDVFDVQDKKIYSNWIDHYGDTGTKLKSEMKEAVENFIKTVTAYPLRVVASATPERSILEVYRDEMWTNDIY
ncbi:MAG: hypothetical protein QM762_13790 [Chryseolinea sp.]